MGDFIGISFTTAPDKKLYQLPDQQFANLYWFRHDWFNDPKNKADFKAKYGYELGVPVNWKGAYEDIAEFFTGRDEGGKKVFGHMDYGKKDPSLGWRFTDAWLSMAGGGDKGLPNGKPVDEWGIRVDANDRPVGSCVARGGDTNGPAAVYSVAKYLEWMKKYAPPEAQGMTLLESGLGVPGQGAIAQQDLLVHDLLRRHGQEPGGDERRRHARVAGRALCRTAPIGNRVKNSATRTPARGR